MNYLDKVLSRCIPDGECLVWTGALNSDGYPAAAGNVKLHRYVCSHYHDIEGLVVRHTCDNIKCLNPEHLIPGTVADNVRDMDERGRRFRVITEDVAKRVLELLSQGTPPVKVASEVGIDRRRVYELRSGKRQPNGRLSN